MRDDVVEGVIRESEIAGIHASKIQAVAAQRASEDALELAVVPPVEQHVTDKRLDGAFDPILPCDPHERREPDVRVGTVVVDPDHSRPECVQDQRRAGAVPAANLEDVGLCDRSWADALEGRNIAVDDLRAVNAGERRRLRRVVPEQLDVRPQVEPTANGEALGRRREARHDDLCERPLRTRS